MIKQIILALCGLCFMQQAQAKTYIGPINFANSNLQSINVLGPTSLEDVQAQSLSITGPLKFKNLTVAGQSNITGSISDSRQGRFSTLTLTGSLKARDFFCDHLNVTGSVDVISLQVKDEADFTGALVVAKESTFNKLMITAHEITLDDTVAQDIVVRKNYNGSVCSWLSWLLWWTSCPKTQTLILKGSTKITGKIVFESGEGLIIIYGQNVTIPDMIHGAHIEKRP